MKILHTADWHIGQFKGPVVDGVNLRSQDTVNCLNYMIKVAEEEKPDIVCVSGDVFHQEQMLFAQLQKGGSASMQKAKYMERQPEVRWQPVNNGMVDVTLCLNEKKVTIEQGQMEDSAKQMMYEYDYHQFRESADKINEETVRASPAKYMSYVPEVEKSLEEQFEELKASNEMLTGCVLEMSELVYQ